MPTDTVSIETLTRSFTAGNLRYVVTAEIKPNSNKGVAPYLTVDLEPISPDAKGLSISADVYEKRGGRWVDVGGGQCQNSLREAFPHDSTVTRLCEIWDQYHLCDMKAGTREQQAVIDQWAANGYLGGDHGCGRYDYSDACILLENAGLLEVPIPESVRANFSYQRDEEGNFPTTYRYGSAWLSGALPSHIEAELRELMSDPAPKPDPEAENRSQFAQLGITMACEYADRNPNMPDAHDMNHYKCTFSRKRKRMTVYFSMGYGHTGEPTINQVWDTITEDSERIGEMDYAEFCSEFGYDEDSRTAERTFKACQHQAARLRTFMAS